MGERLHFPTYVVTEEVRRSLGGKETRMRKRRTDACETSSSSPP